MGAGTVEVDDPQLASVLAPTAADRHFMQEVVQAVVAGNGGDAEDALNHWVRQRFQAYLVHALATSTCVYPPPVCRAGLNLALLVSPVVTVDRAIARAAAAPPGSAEAEAAQATIAAAHLDDYYYRWLARWRTTPAFAAWARSERGEGGGVCGGPWARLLQARARTRRTARWLACWLAGRRPGA